MAAVSAYDKLHVASGTGLMFRAFRMSVLRLKSDWFLLFRANFYWIVCSFFLIIRLASVCALRIHPQFLPSKLRRKVDYQRMCSHLKFLLVQHSFIFFSSQGNHRAEPATRVTSSVFTELIRDPYFVTVVWTESNIAHNVVIKGNGKKALLRDSTLKTISW